MDTINSLNVKNKLLNQRYYLYELIATTAHSQVFLARDVVKHRKCVIKQLNLVDSVKLKPTRELMFRQEAEILQKLSGKHELICQFYDYFYYQGFWYLAQEWIDGVTLEQLRSRRKLSESEIEAILLNLLSVLECIHSLGIVHRDIKPNNIILRSRDNLPVPIDFGVAQYCDDGRESTIVGTPGYMSLEQARGKTAYSNDLYSLGLTAIYLLTGKSPQAIDIEHYVPASNSNLTAVIARAISSNPDLRFTSAAQMRSALQLQRKSSANVRTPRTWIFIVIGLLITSSWFGWRYLTRSEKLLTESERSPVRTTDKSLSSEDLFKDTPADIPVRDLEQDTGVISEPDAQPPVSIDSFPTESLPPTEDLVAKNIGIIKDLQKIIFTPGTKDNEVTQVLGEPVWRKPGFWANSMAWSYENMVLEGIDLGYIFDIQTNELRQVEIAVPPSTDLSIVRAALSEFLAVTVTDDLERGLQAVYHRQKSTHNFVVGDLEGVVQRNHKDRIYVAVWSADFH